jgi:hypothetical protein
VSAKSKWYSNGTVSTMKVPENLENKGDIRTYEIRNRGTPQRRKKHTV